MIKNITLIIFITVFSQSFSQNIPASHKVDWSNAGLSKPFYIPKIVVDFKARGGFNKGVKKNDSLMAVILSEINGFKAIIHFSEGKYLFANPIQLRDNQVLRGEGAKKSEILFDMDNEKEYPIKMYGGTTGTVSTLLIDAKKGNDYINVSNPNNFKADDMIGLLDKNPLFKNTRGGQYEMGQIIIIDRIVANRIFLKSKLRRDFKAADKARVIRYNSIKGAGLMNLKIVRLDTVSGSYGNIYIIYGQDCVLRCVESDNTNYAHVQIFRSINCEISGSYFHGGFDFVSNYRSHGILLHYSTSECLIENNIFEKLKPGVNLQLGANGNVIAYNYFTKPYTIVGGFPSDATGDIWFNGGYGHSNLIEGNVLGSVEFKSTYGSNFESNTFLRNNFTKYGVIMSNSNNRVNDKVVLVGNSFTSDNDNEGQVVLYGKNHFMHGNNVRGTTLPKGTKNVSIKSLFLSDGPAYYINNEIWPPIGYPNTLNKNKIKTQANYINGYHTFCFDDHLSSIKPAKKSIQTILYPNPSSQKVFFNKIANERIKSINVYSMNGQLMDSQNSNKAIIVSHYSNGLYLVNILYESGMNHQVKLMKVNQ